MQCQAITQKGTQCKNTAVLPDSSPICCRIASHIASTQHLASTTKAPITKAPTTKAPTTKAATTVKAATTATTVSNKASTTTTTTVSKAAIQSKAAPITEISDNVLEESREFLAYKAELVSVLNDLFAKGMSQYHDQGKAIEYLKKRFPKDVYQIAKKRVTEGLLLIEKAQDVLIKALSSNVVKSSNALTKDKLNLTLSYYRNQADQTYRLLNTLTNLFEGGGGGTAQKDMIKLLEDNDRDRLEQEELLASLPNIPTSELAALKVKETREPRVAVALSVPTVSHSKAK